MTVIPPCHHRLHQTQGDSDLADPGPGSRPPVTRAQTAFYTGLAPVPRRSGSTIRGEHVSHAGNKRLKRAMFRNGTLDNPQPSTQLPAAA